MTKTNRRPARHVLAAVLVAATVSACATPAPDCGIAATHDLDAAIGSARANLDNGCEAHFDSYMDQLLAIAAGDPGPANKEAFSDFLVWATDRGLLSKRQAGERWNRYFSIKFVSLRGDYNNCAQTCPARDRVMDDLERELADKERGLLQASLDQDAYQRADRLLKETELVLEATCRACEAGGR